MYSLIIVFCGVATGGYTSCERKETLAFDSKSTCENFMLGSDKRRWGEGFVVAYCAPKKGG